MRKEVYDETDFINKKYTEQDIIDIFPETDEYVLVFGTSHTHGDCERGEYTLLAEDDMWTNILSKKTGIKIVNVAVPGNSNRVIVQQMIDFLSLPESVISRCKGIIGEIRVGDNAGSFNADIVSDLIVEDDTLNPMITMGTAFSKLNVRVANWKDSMNMEFVNPHSIGEDPVAYAKHIAGNAFIDGEPDYIPEAAIQIIKDLIETHYKTVALTVRPVTSDFDEIRVMKQLCDSNNIPFMWFCWDECEYLDKDDYALCERVYRKTTNIFDDTVFGLEDTVGGVYYREHGPIVTQQHMCECGHYDGNVNRFVADKLQSYFEFRNIT